MGETENQLSQVVLCSPYACHAMCVCMCVRVHTHPSVCLCVCTILKCNLKKKNSQVNLSEFLTNYLSNEQEPRKRSGSKGGSVP